MKGNGGGGGGGGEREEAEAEAEAETEEEEGGGEGCCLVQEEPQHARDGASARRCRLAQSRDVGRQLRAPRQGRGAGKGNTRA